MDGRVLTGRDLCVQNTHVVVLPDQSVLRLDRLHVTEFRAKSAPFIAALAAGAGSDRSAGRRLSTEIKP